MVARNALDIESVVRIHSPQPMPIILVFLTALFCSVVKCGLDKSIEAWYNVVRHGDIGVSG